MPRSFGSIPQLCSFGSTPPHARTNTPPPPNPPEREKHDDAALRKEDERALSNERNRIVPRNEARAERSCGVQRRTPLRTATPRVYRWTAQRERTAFFLPGWW